MRAMIFLYLALTGLLFGAEPQGVFSFRNGFGGHFQADPPLSWSATDNVVWKHALKKRSNASPVIVGERVFVLEEPHRLICLNKSDGALLWQRDHDPVALGGASRTLPRSEWIDTYGYTTPTPVSDGKRVWCVFGHGFVVCYDLEGKLLWSAPLEVADATSGVAVSPCLIDGRLIAGGKGNDRICAFDASSGRKLWSCAEGTQEGSSVPVNVGGRALILASAGMLLDPADGKVLQRGLLGAGWKGDTQKQPINWGPTVVSDGERAYFHVHFQPDQFNTALRAVTLDASGRAAQVWEFHANADGNIRGRMGNSPLLLHGLLYALKDNGQLQVLQASDGKLVYTQKLPKHSYASLTLAGPNIFAIGSSVVTIFKPGRTYEQVAQFNHEFRDFIASPVFEGNRLYFRDAAALWCIQKPADAMKSIARSAAITDDGPDLADTAKTAPLLQYSDWMLQYDHSRARVKRFSFGLECAFAMLAVVLGVMRLRRVDRPGAFELCCIAAPLLLALPLLNLPDKLGNAHWLVLAWCLCGAIFCLGQRGTAEPLRSRRTLPTPDTTKLQRAASFAGGWLIGAATGLLLHYLPMQLMVMWYVIGSKGE